MSLFSALHYFVHVPKRATFCPATFNLFCHLTLVAISVVTLNCLSVTRRLADIYCWCSASWSLNKGRLSPETQHAVASNEYAMLILGRKKPHPVSVCSMRYLQWVARSLSIVSLLQKTTTFRTLAPLTSSGKHIEQLEFWSVCCNVTAYMCLFASLQAEPVRKQSTLKQTKIKQN